MAGERIVAVALVTQREVEALGSSFERLWSVDETPCFPQLLQAIDEADRQLWRDWGEAERRHGEPQRLIP